MKTAELIGAALDWAVAVCEEPNVAKRVEIKRTPKSVANFQPSTDWAQGGPIIEREGIGLFFHRAYGNRWKANHPTAPYMLAETPLIAAMRCYVASKLGDDIEIPEELLP